MLKREVPRHLVLTAKLSCGITCVVSVAYILLTILGIIFYFNCDTGNAEGHSQRFWADIFKVYLQNAECQSQTPMPDLTQSFTIFVLMTITLSFSVINLFTGAALFWHIEEKDHVQYFNIFVYTYIGSWVCTLVVDLTLGSHLGMDITHLNNLMDSQPQYDIFTDILRQGAFYLMTVALKGYVVHIINIVLILLLIIYLNEYQEEANKEVHPIFLERPLHAFEYVNNSFVDDIDSPSTARAIQDNYNNTRAAENFYRSQSWNHQLPPTQPSVPVSTTMNASHRPFSYLEDIKSVRPPAAALSDWRSPRPKPAPPVPAPDYSPQGQRRLKSALKAYHM